MPNPDELIGSSEAASIIGVSRATLTRWVQSGRIEPAKKLPGLTGAALFDRDEIEAMKPAVSQ
ncbi:helix-turn-helix domain-containing protein [Rhodococcoides fascians]|uniref:helix-turn-helix domain-containing protein n=1 Tax=Rhodococcoides fascians TaxID=1828 RepID=UPI00050D0892|nr:helix-turn-helix domain-containing protein [Rhodococcus fascians]